MKNNWLAKVSTSAAKFAGKAEFTIKKNSPEILLGAGIVGFVGTIVLACRATCRADEVLEFHRRKIKDINDAKEIADADPEGEMSYDVEIYRQDKAIRYLKTTGNLAKLYAPTVAVGTLSLACILTSRNIMQKRYLGVVAAYNGLSAAFEEYRKRVRDEYGEGLDKHFRYGTTYEELPVYDENGKKTKEKEQVENTNSNLVAPTDDYCRFFDSSNPNWDPNPAFSMMWLRGQQNLLNDILHTRGHVFLNEVYDALGFEHTPQGAVLGWLDNGDDGYIDFFGYEKNGMAKENVRKFVNGVDNVIMLEFNHDGVIWDKI